MISWGWNKCDYSGALYFNYLVSIFVSEFYEKAMVRGGLLVDLEFHLTQHSPGSDSVIRDVSLCGQVFIQAIPPQPQGGFRLTIVISRHRLTIVISRHTNLFKFMTENMIFSKNTLLSLTFGIKSCKFL